MNTYTSYFATGSKGDFVVTTTTYGATSRRETETKTKHTTLPHIDGRVWVTLAFDPMAWTGTFYAEEIS